jgi:hypothetical protein
MGNVDPPENIQLAELQVTSSRKAFGSVIVKYLYRETVMRGTVSANSRAFSSRLEIRLCNSCHGEPSF